MGLDFTCAVAFGAVETHAEQSKCFSSTHEQGFPVFAMHWLQSKSVHPHFWQTPYELFRSDTTLPSTVIVVCITSIAFVPDFFARLMTRAPE